MKSASVIKIVCWSLTALLLTAVLVCGIVFGNVVFGFGNGGSFSLGSFTTYPDSSSYLVGDGRISDDISSLYIDWPKGNVEIKTHSGEDIEISESGADNSQDKQRMRYLAKNGRLTIHAAKSGAGSIPEKTLTILIPESEARALTKVEVDTVSAELSAENLVLTEKLSFDSVSGSAEFFNITSRSFDSGTTSGDITVVGSEIDYISTDSVSGSIVLEGSISNLEFDSASGSVSLESIIIPRSIEGDTVSGDVDIKIPESDEGFAVEFDSISGDLKCDFPTTSSDGKTVYAGGLSQFEFDSTSGDVTIIRK